MLHPDVHEIELAAATAAVDPKTQATTAPFVTWVGRIRVDARNVASILRRTGDEDLIETSPDVAAAIEAAFDADAARACRGDETGERHLVGTWLPMRSLVPMLAHLSDPEAYDICQRIAAPDVEQTPARDGLAPLPFAVRAARVNGVPGWCAALAESTSVTWS